MSISKAEKQNPKQTTLFELICCSSHVIKKVQPEEIEQHKNNLR